MSFNLLLKEKKLFDEYESKNGVGPLGLREKLETYVTKFYSWLITFIR